MNDVPKFWECRGSRHVQMIGEALLDGQTCHMLADDPQHCAESMLSVLVSLYRARTRLAEVYEQCAVIAETATYRARWARGASDAQPIQPCEIAAAIRKASTP